MGDAYSGFCRYGLHRRSAGAASSPHTNFSVSSAVGFLALFGVSVQTGVIMIEFINQLRAQRKAWNSPITNTLWKRPSRALFCVFARS